MTTGVHVLTNSPKNFFHTGGSLQLFSAQFIQKLRILSSLHAELGNQLLADPELFGDFLLGVELVDHSVNDHDLVSQADLGSMLASLSGSDAGWFLVLIWSYLIWVDSRFTASVLNFLA